MPSPFRTISATTCRRSLAIGSNWYGGGSPSVGGSHAADLQVAEPLDATPIGTPTCTHPSPGTANNPAQIIAFSGSGQTTSIDTPFANPLNARVVDQLGGAVMDVTVNFSTPATGASATLGTVSGTTDFNGMLATTATANGTSGAYDVVASSGSLAPASFALTNGQAMAGITLDAGTLDATYDGNPHIVTASTSPSGLSYGITYDGSSVAPTNAGSYTVVATITDPNHSGSTSGTLTIHQASASLALSDLTQTHDGNPKPVTVTTTPAGVGYTVTYDGSSTAPSAVGDYAVVASVADPNYAGNQVSGLLHIIEADAPDISVSITDFRDYVQYGQMLTYGIVISNVGNTDITGAPVNDILPATLVPAAADQLALLPGYRRNLRINQRQRWCQHHGRHSAEWKPDHRA